jgi:malate dehydrogenase (oxaloacetate-decarboxylating)(NADP+)
MNKDSKRREVLYHAKPTPGKIQVVPTKICNTKRFVFGLFSGVALFEIAKDI